MRLFFRTFLFSAGLVGVLGYLTYLLHRDPSQVEARVGRALEKVLATQPRMEGCSQPFLGSVAVKRIEIPAAPVLVERNVLELEDVRVDDPSGDRMFRPRKAPESEAAPLTVHAARGVLRADHEVSTGPGTELSERWSVGELLKADPAIDLLSTQHAEAIVDSLEVQIRDQQPPRRELVHRFECRDVELRSSGGGFLIDADLVDGEHWSSGQIEASWTNDAGLRIRGGADDVKGVDRWLPMLRDEDRQLWSDFQPSGPFDLDVEELRIDRNGKTTLRATVRHYDTSVRLGSSGFELRHLQGPMAVSETEVSFGGNGPGRKTTAELLGLGVELDGHLSASESEIRLSLSQAPLETIFGSSWLQGRPRAAELKAQLHPQGHVNGDLTIRFRRGAREQLAGSFQLRDVELGSASFISGLLGSLHYDDVESEPGQRSSKGKLTIVQATLAGLGKGVGEVRFDWGASGVKVELSDLKVEPPPAAGEAGGPAATGSVFASADWDWNEGLKTFDLRWLGLMLDGRLLKARNTSGSLQKGAGGGGKGSVEIDGARLPAKWLWPECTELDLGKGKAQLRLEEGSSRRIVISSLKLTGESGSLRATGVLSLSGELELVVFLDQSPTHSVLGKLPDDSRPSDWKEAAKSSYRAFRITGSVTAPRSREIGALDPAFVKGL